MSIAFNPSTRVEFGTLIYVSAWLMKCVERGSVCTCRNCEIATAQMQREMLPTLQERVDILRRVTSTGAFNELKSPAFLILNVKEPEPSACDVGRNWQAMVFTATCEMHRDAMLFCDRVTQVAA